MLIDTKLTLQTSLCRFVPGSEESVSDETVQNEIAQAFKEYRAFPFIADAGIVSGVRNGEAFESHIPRFTEIKNNIIDTIAHDDTTLKTRLLHDTHLSSRIVNAISFIHKGLAEIGKIDLMKRRFVLIKEKPQSPTIYYTSEGAIVISHVGQGPSGIEIPTIYLGFNIFDALSWDQKRKQKTLFEAFKSLLLIEERAIETGYSHIEDIPSGESAALNHFIDEVIRLSTLAELEYAKVPEHRVIRRFSKQNRQVYLKMLDKRLPESELNFDYYENLRAIKSLERMARRYKKSDDYESFNEVVRLLVAASGHDIKEIRNYANIILERLLAPKEFDAPLATRFVTIHQGTEHCFEFDLSRGKTAYFLRIYNTNPEHEYVSEKTLSFIDLDLDYNKKIGKYAASHLFDRIGHFDYLLYRKYKNGNRWCLEKKCSGRINVIPDIRGVLVVEIFPDIHGHTRIYWGDKTDHPGLVYNENGEVIRIGRFSDITAHLEELKERYRMTALYLLGVQKRGDNKEDWAPEATSPTPFSPVSLTEIEPFLGGENELKELIKQAHRLDVKVIVDVVPHVNRKSRAVPDDWVVKCYDDGGRLVDRASTDGRYGSWNDGKLLNYRKFEVWKWIADSINVLIDKFDIDGIRFDSAHAVPIMMKKNNFPYYFDKTRSYEDMVEGTIIVNDREDDHYITTSYYDSACSEIISNPFHYFLMQSIERKLRAKKKNFFIHIAECYWGRERFLTRTGIIPYNSALFKICEKIIRGESDVREIYHLYDNYFPSSLPPGTELLGILGNHDEHRAITTFGHRGLRAAVALTCFMSNIIMDYEGSAEGEGWKVYLDNIYVNWNQFEWASHRGLEGFYKEMYGFFRENRGNSYMIWTNNYMVAGAMKCTEDQIWLGAFNFSDTNQHVSLQFDNPALPIDDDGFYRVVDPMYSPVTGQHNHFTGKELRTSKIYTTVPYTDRVKILKLEKVDDARGFYREFLKDSFFRFCRLRDQSLIASNFSFNEISDHADTFDHFISYFNDNFIPLFWKNHSNYLKLGLKRAFYHMAKEKAQPTKRLLEFIDKLERHKSKELSEIGLSLQQSIERKPILFISAEAEPFSMSGGLANVLYGLPRELARMGEEVYVITPYYRHGGSKAVEKMHSAVKKYRIKYTGKNVRFMIQNIEYEAGVHAGVVDGIKFFLLDHPEFFDGLYWGYTTEEKLRRRIALARASCEIIVHFDLRPNFTLTNDAYTGIFNGIVRTDPYYAEKINFRDTTFLHIIHNGGWQYFDAFYRYNNGFDYFDLFNLPGNAAADFTDPVDTSTINCMAAGVRFADQVVTVSPSYAIQIQIASDGLEHLLHNVVGINNAIGSDFYSRVKRRTKGSGFLENFYPRFKELVGKDKILKEKIETRFPELTRGARFCESVENKMRREVLTRMRNKLLLQVQHGLSVDPDKILFTMIHRIADQKGFQLLLEASEGIIKNLGFQGIIGGHVASGDLRGEELMHGLFQLRDYYPDDISFNLGFQDVSVSLLSSDIFLMPSMHEPGGISQLEALACGCLVVARATGGLRDTITPLHIKGQRVVGNGFLFSDFNSWSFYDAMERCASFYHQADEVRIFRARTNAKKSGYYWNSSAKRYIDALYGINEIIRSD
jgi:starch synthase